MFHLEKVFCAGNPTQVLRSVAKVEWLRFLSSASSVARALYDNGFGEWEALVKEIGKPNDPISLLGLQPAGTKI